MFTSRNPTDTVIALDDRTLKRVSKLGVPELSAYAQVEHRYRNGEYIWFGIKIAGDNIIEPRDRNFDFTWIADTHMAYRCLLRARWKLYEPVWTKRTPPEWKDDYHNAPGSDAQLLCCRTRNLIGGQPANAKGELRCIACGGTIKWRCAEHFNYVSFKCIDQPCIKWQERYRG